MDESAGRSKRAARTKAAIIGVVAALSLSLSWTFVRRPLDVPDAPVARLPAAAPPPAAQSPRIGLSLLPSAEIETRHGLSVRGAGLLSPVTSALVAFVVEHPEGRLLIDAGMGRRAREHVSSVPWLMQQFIDLELTSATIDGLAEHGVAPDDLLGIVLTHAHWDHVSGLEELPNVPVFMSAAELTLARSSEGDLLFRQIDAASRVDAHTPEFDDGPFGPFASSHDFFDDGSVVLVPLAGHTTGSIGIFVTLASGRRFLFIGDTAWTREGVDWPAEKPWVSRFMADGDDAGVREQLILLHQLQRQEPDLTIVPAHDARVHAQFAIWPQREE